VYAPGLTAVVFDMYIIHMTIIKWNHEKNQLLKETRGVCFEDVLTAIKEGKLLETVKHPNSKRYPNQFVYLVIIQGYV